MSDPYKYYTKEQYEQYGDILETASEIDAKIAKAKAREIQNRKQAEQYKKEWAERTTASGSRSENFVFERTFMTTLYNAYNRPERQECEFLP
jgi:hypothetical protein